MVGRPPRRDHRPEEAPFPWLNNSLTQRSPVVSEAEGPAMVAKATAPVKNQHAFEIARAIQQVRELDVLLVVANGKSVISPAGGQGECRAAGAIHGASPGTASCERRHYIMHGRDAAGEIAYEFVDKCLNATSV